MQQVLMALEASGAETRILDQILKRLDDSAALANKRYEEKVSFNTVVSQDLQAVRKQIDLTQADVEEACHAASVVTAPAMGRPQAGEHRAAAVGLGAAGFPRLANDGPPPISTVPDLQRPHPPPIRPNVPPHHHEDREQFVKPPKHDFPRFDGELPNLWLDRCGSYFELYHTPVHNWVTTASLYLDGRAALWWQAFRRHAEQWVGRSLDVPCRTNLDQRSLKGRCINCYSFVSLVQWWNIGFSLKSICITCSLLIHL
ncbi:hypothetical protein QYE76_020140 [Lolium multiflorum]|uniref:Retrotransposon gag domain-containing protein n=1 Tax=Lolium multiflorum TaxID=4521 RepID=A0AAD8R8A6_LOLMU|nr:hypothetical protein QYE76_020140 [Lolium multiflorum]